MPKTRTVAVIDVGSNSVVLLVARLHDNGQIEPINEAFAITKLGKEIAKNGLLEDNAIQKTIDASKEMREIAEQDGACDIFAVATYAVRTAKNRSEFLVKFHKELNIFPQVLSGKEEAKFTYLGATFDMPENKDVITIDVGGGSSEIAFGTKQIMIEAHSLPIGCVSLSEQFNIGKKEWITDKIAAKNHIRKNLFHVVDPVNNWIKGKNVTVIASGGTATTYAAILIGKNIYDRNHIHMKQSSRQEASVTARKISRMSIENRIKIPGMEKERAESLPAGLMILSEILGFFKFDKFYISANGLRTGILKQYLQSIR
jgi:exopolyphosphatase/guanosine-5'-triphosphate,3'-diphosphate pyrophosphatase